MEEAEPAEREAFLQRYAKVEYYNELLYWTRKCRSEREPYMALPFYNINRRRIELIPSAFYFTSSGSNGMAAGNSPQEALVQGISEIVERHVLKKMFEETPCLPDVPDEYIRRWPYVWERMERLRKLPGYQVKMKDCSFGGRYPVAALFVIERNTGRYSVRAGCHPDYGIAMERAVTETFQGPDIDGAVYRSELDFRNRYKDDNGNMMNVYATGIGKYPFELLRGTPSWEFVPVEEAAGRDNRQLLGYLIDLLQGEGHEVLIRDVSYSGFYSFQILVPGFSETSRRSLLGTKMENTRAFLAPYWMDVRRFDEQAVKLALACLDYYSTDHTMAKMSCQTTVAVDFDYPGEECSLGWLYASAMCCCYLGRYGEAGERMSQLARVDELFCEPKKVLEKQYPCIDTRREDGVLDFPEGPNARCGKYLAEFRSYMSEHPIDQARVAEYLA